MPNVWKKFYIAIIHHDQNAFVKERTIVDAVRTISDVMEFMELKGYQGIMTAIDFEKAFDSMSRDFLFKSLESFGFGVSFIKWIKTFYSNITSCVANNVFFTPSFRIKRGGVRQGDPRTMIKRDGKSELLAISIRGNVRIKGIKVDGNEIKLVTFADDMKSFLRDIQSLITLLDVIKSFGRYSGLEIMHQTI